MVKLANNRSAGWALWDRFDAPQYEGDGVYLTRWRVIQTPLFGIYVHRFTGPDPRSTLHDHPWSFLSIILRGSYTETRLDPRTMTVAPTRRVRRFNFMPTRVAHSILVLNRTPTWSLVFAGRRLRTWGYWEPVPPPLIEGVPHDRSLVPGWRWTEFSKHKHNDAFVAALARRKARDAE